MSPYFRNPDDLVLDGLCDHRHIHGSLHASCLASEEALQQESLVCGALTVF